MSRDEINMQIWYRNQFRRINNDADGMAFIYFFASLIVVSGAVTGWNAAEHWVAVAYPYKYAACFYFFTIVGPIEFFAYFTDWPGLLAPIGCLAYAAALLAWLHATVSVLDIFVDDGWELVKKIMAAPLLMCAAYYLVLDVTLIPLFKDPFFNPAYEVFIDVRHFLRPYLREFYENQDIFICWISDSCDTHTS